MLLALITAVLMTFANCLGALSLIILIITLYDSYSFINSKVEFKYLEEITLDLPPRDYPILYMLYVRFAGVSFGMSYSWVLDGRYVGRPALRLTSLLLRLVLWYAGIAYALISAIAVVFKIASAGDLESYLFKITKSGPHTRRIMYYRGAWRLNPKYGDAWLRIRILQSFPRAGTAEIEERVAFIKRAALMAEDSKATLMPRSMLFANKSTRMSHLGYDEMHSNPDYVALATDANTARLNDYYGREVIVNEFMGGKKPTTLIGVPRGELELIGTKVHRVPLNTLHRGMITNGYSDTVPPLYRQYPDLVLDKLRAMFYLDTPEQRAEMARVIGGYQPTAEEIIENAQNVLNHWTGGGGGAP